MISDDIGILIPALDPDERLLTLVDNLRQKFEAELHIVIVDDGSSSKTIFERLAARKDERLKILQHTTNMGKGSALKTGFHYYIANFPSLKGIATLDADGQHTVDSLSSCINLFVHHENELVIGARTFSKNIPLRSRLGNVLTNKIVRRLTRLPLTDTQTGLRVIPMAYVRELIDFSGSRFEFEFDMLLRAKEFNVSIREQPISTIYLDGNSSSHFRVIRDSIMIYSRFLKFSASGLISFFVDIALFAVTMMFLQTHSLGNILIATVISRVTSSIVNYLINRHLVFQNAGEKTLIKYLVLLVLQMIASGYLTHAITQLFGQTTGSFVPVVSKMICDFLLFIFSYNIQKHLIFKDHVYA